MHVAQCGGPPLASTAALPSISRFSNTAITSFLCASGIDRQSKAACFRARTVFLAANVSVHHLHLWRVLWAFIGSGYGTMSSLTSGSEGRPPFVLCGIMGVIEVVVEAIVVLTNGMPEVASDCEEW